MTAPYNISAIQSIPAYDDSALVSAVTTISNQITEQFGEYDSAYAFPNVLHGETSTQKLYGVLPSSFSEVPDNSDLLYSSSSSIQVYGSLIETSTEGSPDYYYEKCVPGYQSVGSMNALGYSFTIIKGTDAPAANSFIYTTMPVSFSVTDLAGTVHSFESSFSFRCSKNVAYATCSAFVYPSWDSSGTWKGWYAYYKPNFISSSRGFLLTTDGEPTVRLLTSLPDTDRYYIYSNTSEAVPVVYASRFTGFLQAQADRLVNAIATGGVAGSGTLAVDLAPIITRLQAVTGRMDDILAQLQSTSGSATCEHTYSQHMEQEATCILPGLMISTCSKCGDSYSEIIDPLGHDWVISSHVDAVTDPDTGEETASAYDIYTCSRCGKTYEDHTGNGAPDEDYSSSSISQLVVKVFSKLGTFAGKLIEQRVKVLSNVALSIPYEDFVSLQQVVYCAEKNGQYDKEHDTLTVTLVLGDEFSVQMNSRNFKSNIDPLFLNTLLTCRHYHISMYYTAQRFGHVDALLRQVTSCVVDCDKLWRFQRQNLYDAWEMENATNTQLLTPLTRRCWFVTNKDYAAYDTLACVGNLQKSFKEGDMLSEEEILSLRRNEQQANMDGVVKPSRKWRRSQKKLRK